MAEQPKSRIYWRNGKAYGDFRDFADVGGRREALKPAGMRVPTTDPDVAAKLSTDRVADLETMRRNQGLFGQTIVERGLAEYAAHHLEEKARSGRVTEDHLAISEHYLGRAVEFFRGGRPLSGISTSNVQEFVGHLQTMGNGRGGTLSGGSIRKHLNALSNLYRRAASEGYVPPGHNPIAALLDKPTADHHEAAWLEVHEAALFLDATERHRPVKAYCALRAIHPLVATFLLTGGRKAEVLGLEVKDVSFDRKTVTFRPNEHRRLKTRNSHRTVPLWPQLEEILRPYVFSATAPRGEGLLFPSDRGGGMIWDMRKALDAIARSAAWEAGEIRTRMFRHTYCATRLQTLDRGAPVSPWVVSREMGHGDVTLVDRVYGHLGDVRHRSETVEFRVEQHREQLAERAQKLAHLSL